MKKICLSLLLSISFGSTVLISMEKESTQESEFLTPQQVLEQSDPLPDEYENTKKWIAEKKDFFNTLRMSEISNQKDFIGHVFGITLVHKFESLSEKNYILDTGLAQADPDHQTVVRYAGGQNTLNSLASSAGIDSGPPQNMFERVMTSNGKPGWQYKTDVLQKATHGNFQVHQHTSMLAYYLMMKKRLKGKKVQPVQTWAVQYGDEEFCDANYVIVQPKLGDKFALLSKLPDKDLNAIVDKSLLPDLADTVDSGAWNLTKENLWYDAPNGTFHITDLEKPNNEGWGPNPGTNPRWGTAVFSYKGDGKSSHPWKWKHNIRCGYDAVNGSILANREDLQQEWAQIKKERAPKE